MVRAKAPLQRSYGAISTCKKPSAKLTSKGGVAAHKLPLLHSAPPPPPHMYQRRSKPSIGKSEMNSKEEASKEQRPLLRSVPVKQITSRYPLVASTGHRENSKRRGDGQAKRPMLRSVPVPRGTPHSQSMPETDHSSSIRCRIPVRPNLWKAKSTSASLCESVKCTVPVPPNLRKPISTVSTCESVTCRVPVPPRLRSTPLSKSVPCSEPAMEGRSEPAVKYQREMSKVPLKKAIRPILRSAAASKKVYDCLNHLKGKLKTYDRKERTKNSPSQSKRRIVRKSQKVSSGEPIKQDNGLEKKFQAVREPSPSGGTGSASRRTSGSKQELERRKTTRRSPSATNAATKLPEPLKAKTSETESAKTIVPKEDGNARDNAPDRNQVLDSKPQTCIQRKAVKIPNLGKRETCSSLSEISGSGKIDRSGEKNKPNERTKAGEAVISAKQDRSATQDRSAKVHNSGEDESSCSDSDSLEGSSYSTSSDEDENESEDKKPVTVKKDVSKNAPGISALQSSLPQYKKECFKENSDEPVSGHPIQRKYSGIKRASTRAGNLPGDAEDTNQSDRLAKRPRSHTWRNNKSEFFSLSYADQLIALGQDVTAGGCEIKENAQPETDEN